jgi:hypothetical protein
LLLASISDETLKLLVGNADRCLSARCVIEHDVDAALLDDAHDGLVRTEVDSYRLL